MNALKLIENFDKKMLEYEDYSVVTGKAVRYILEVIIFILCLIPIQEIKVDKDLIELLFIPAIFLTLCTYFYLLPYIQVSEQGKVSSIYHKLKYFPISSYEIFKSRWRYLLNYVRKMGLIFLSLQVFSAIVFEKNFTVWNVLYPILVIGIFSVFTGICMIYPRQ